MQAFTKKMMIAFLALFLGLSVISCGGEDTTTEETPNESETPTLSNPDKVFISTDDYTVTYGELFNEVKINDGLNQLLNLVDTDMISSYLSAVTNTDIDNRILELTYGTSDADEIADITDEEKVFLEKSYADSMYLLGYTTETTERNYVKLVVARENYAVAQMIDSDNVDEAWYAGPESVAEYYDVNYNYDINTIKIRFISEADAKAVLRSFNLVSKSGALKLYTGTTPLEEVPSSQLNDTNTATLTDAELLTKFIELYNYIYGAYRDVVATDATLETLLANEDLTQEYDVLAEANSSLSTFIYDSLGTYSDFTTGENDLAYYTYEPVKYYSSSDTSYYMILNLAKTEKADVEDFEGTEADLVALIGQEIYDEMEQEIIDLNLSSSSFTANRMAELRAENDFDIYDYYLGMDYSMTYSEFEINEEGHSTMIASYSDAEISADDLFSYAFNINAPLYTIYAVQSKAVVAAHYEDIYCPDSEVCEYDVLENTSEVMLEHKDAYLSLEEQFNSSYYASYYTFDEYLYLAYGVKTYEEMLFDYYVTSTLQPFVIYDAITENNHDLLNYLMELSQPYYDNYFSLNVEHILIYLDRDENGSPDDYAKFYESLDDATVFDQKLADFELAIRTYLDDSDNTMASLVKEFKAAKRDNVTWGEFKVYGFYLLTESLGELTYTDSVSTYETPFVDTLIDMYQLYNLEANENEEFLLADSLTETSYGLHLIKVEKGTDFEKPSALFTMTYDDDLEPEYLPGVANATDELTFAQLQIWSDYRFTVIAASTGDLEAIYGLTQPEMPASLLDAIETYFQTLYDSTFVIGYLNNIVVNQLYDAEFDNEYAAYVDFTEANFQSKLAAIEAIYIYQIYVELDHRVTD
ncbi:MAG: hypothetical protein JEZ05_03825 [Tenericutes bacterium]|nr:hypothetical protein [Mycoplasmatota bacterium]